MRLKSAKPSQDWDVGGADVPGRSGGLEIEAEMTFPAGSESVWAFNLMTHSNASVSSPFARNT